MRSVLNHAGIAQDKSNGVTPFSSTMGVKEVSTAQSPPIASAPAVPAHTAWRALPMSVRGWTARQWTLVFFGACVVLAYGSTLIHLASRWSAEPEYSHGFFVPMFAAALLWFRRGELKADSPGHWSGLLLLGVAAAMRFAAFYWYYTLIGALALIPALAGLALVIGGWPLLRWALPSIGFLLFMIPLPGIVSSLLAHPLQRVATIASTYMLQLFGVPAVAAGNVIWLTSAKIGVVEACNGLRMLILFFAVATAVALLVKRPPWERLLLVASAVPIALCVNIARITLTGLFYEFASADLAERFFHDLAGLFMGPTALLLLWLEMKFLDQAMLPVESGPLAARI